MTAPKFAIHYEIDGFSTEKKLMGRQASGKAFMKAVARKWADAEITAMTRSQDLARTMLRQLRGDGFRGTVNWRSPFNYRGLAELGAVYTAAPISSDLAHTRNFGSPANHSLIGLTHTLSSHQAMDLVAQMVAAPFQSWDALICTSRAARTVVGRIQADMRDWMAAHWGATRFSAPVLPIIPLGVDTDALDRSPEAVAMARQAFGFGPDDVVFLFAGRLSFHAKAHPAPLYLAAEQVARRTGRSIVCIEAGQYPNQHIADAFEEARRVMAPSVRFIHARGDDADAYRNAWLATDVFTSLSDNIQETFGLTPVEAMAAGLPVLVSDWDGYKDTVRDGVDGYRIPVVMPPQGAGREMAVRHAAGVESYDRYLSRTSMATSVDIAPLVERMVALATDPGLRARLGAAGRARAKALFDWSVVLDQFNDLVGELEALRPASEPAVRWPNRPDPFTLFEGFGSAAISASWGVAPAPDSKAALADLLALRVVDYIVAPDAVPRDDIEALHAAILGGAATVGEAVAALGSGSPGRVAALMLLAKLDLIRLTPRA